ncbi:DUF2779 domain-containing protein [Candidatus Latescibacterota bacterium]
MRRVTKGVFLNALTCPTLGWRTRKSEGKPPSDAERFRMEQGQEVGRRARALWPDAAMVGVPDMEAAADGTQVMMGDATVHAMCEAAFVVGDCVTRADILERANGGWQLTEVKSATNEKDELVDDLAYTTMVAQAAGVAVSSARLLLVSKGYRLGAAPEALFEEYDHTQEALERAGVFAGERGRVERVTGQDLMPEPELTLDCRRCPFLDECFPQSTGPHILRLPRLSQKKLDALTAAGCAAIPDIPESADLTAPQRRVRNCIATGVEYVGDGLGEALDAVEWPACYLDFETVMAAIPLYPEVAPYTQIPTQYSLHRRQAPGGEVDHMEYLADPARDCRRELLERLLDDLGDSGSVVAYSSFEKTRLNGLAELYPQYAGRVARVVERLVDLEAIIRAQYCHPGFEGSTSIKKVLPVLVPELSYDDLAIGDGDTAMATFAWMAQGRISGAEADRARQNLLVYCERDTYAMVRLHEELLRRAA